MKNQFLILGLIVLFAFVDHSYGQIDLPRNSPQAKVSQTVGTSEVTISYSRPSVKDREIWGALVPYGMNDLGFGTSKAAPWRAGADENTTITFTDDAMVNGKAIEAGTYGLFIEVKEGNNASLILSSDTKAWGSYFYDPDHDVLKVDINSESHSHTEMLTYQFSSVDKNSATAELLWEEKAFPFSVSFDVTKIVLDNFKSEMNGRTGFDRQNWERAARFAVRNGGDLDEAAKWVDMAREGNFFSQKTFNNTALKAQILKKQGNSDAFKATIDEAITMANTNQLNQLGYQLIGTKDFDQALTCFKKNVEDNPTSANAYDSLGECYKEMGDKANAIKALKKSLSLDPPANVKANSEKLLKELGAM